VVGQGCTVPRGLPACFGGIRAMFFSAACATSQQAQHNHDDQTVISIHRSIAFLRNFGDHGIY
jgi:hypothetical protein